MTGVIINDISKVYGNKVIYEHYSANFPAGRTTVIMGSSGCGKTTLLNMIMGLEKPDSGNISFIHGVDNDDACNKANKNIRFSAIFQENRLLEKENVLTNVSVVAKKSNLSDSAVYILTKLGLGDNLNTKVNKLSGGMKRRVAIARALMADYDILIADEPFTGLDDETKSDVINFFKESTKGRTVIVVTHSENEKTELESRENE